MRSNFIPIYYMQLCIALSHTNFFMKEEANPWYNPSLLSNYPFGDYLIRP